ncbi:hypothetical protein GCM10017044_00730 [Kordiimonas sediminis]|uniref:Thioredoxin domain-containing protein n=1 Tax=Kordiimonas sediminis TaxID=1735581 RepID=A0A919E409_9PROT|nr:redoxin domain-containing protein [Kordiimonas sediminis]GHF10903.1 hypothetical protein GCM10017044_00730 [Kordiimonas sediminis]
MTTALIISQILSWVIIVALALMVLALMRQVGVLHERIAPAGALSMNQNLKKGDTAPTLAANLLGGGKVSIGGAERNGKSQLLFFLSPDCPVCKTLLPALGSMKKAEAKWLDVILASDGAEPSHRAFIKERGLEHFDYVVSELLGRSFGVSKLPYAVLIDENGKIASLGLINSREHLESLFEAKERDVASIQDYMQSRTAS